jgi:hypothetical protein
MLVFIAYDKYYDKDLLGEIMAKQLVNLGTGPNTKNGDTVREAFRKVNLNFNELYSNLDLPIQTGNGGKYLKTDGTSLFWVDVRDDINIVIDGGTP